MAKEQYRIIKKSEFPVRDLVQSEDGNVVFSVFNRGSYFDTSMNIAYSHPKTGEKITFRETTTSETIGLLAHGFNQGTDPNKDFDAKRDIFDKGRVFHAGRLVKAKKGIYTNTRETDEKVLTDLLNGADKFDGIYLINEKIAFIPYDSFKQGNLEAGEFVEQGLARGLEHTTGKRAEKLARIVSEKNYPFGVKVEGFEFESWGEDRTILGFLHDHNSPYDSESHTYMGLSILGHCGGLSDSFGLLDKKE